MTDYVVCYRSHQALHWPKIIFWKSSSGKCRNNDLRIFEGFDELCHVFQMDSCRLGPSNFGIMQREAVVCGSKMKQNLQSYKQIWIYVNTERTDIRSQDDETEI